MKHSVLKLQRNFKHPNVVNWSAFDASVKKRSRHLCRLLMNNHTIPDLQIANTIQKTEKLSCMRWRICKLFCRILFVLSTLWPQITQRTLRNPQKRFNFGELQYSANPWNPQNLLNPWFHRLQEIHELNHIILSHYFIGFIEILTNLPKSQTFKKSKR